MTAPWIISDAYIWPVIAATKTRLDELLEWVRANGIEPKNVPIEPPMTIEDGPDGQQIIRYTAYVNTGVPGEPYAEEERTVPMTTPPPAHWRPAAVTMKEA